MSEVVRVHVSASRARPYQRCDSLSETNGGGGSIDKHPMQRSFRFETGVQFSNPILRPPSLQLDLFSKIILSMILVYFNCRNFPTLLLPPHGHGWTSVSMSERRTNWSKFFLMIFKSAYHRILIFILSLLEANTLNFSSCTVAHPSFPNVVCSLAPLVGSRCCYLSTR